MTLHSPTQRVFATFGDRIELLPHAEERVMHYQELPNGNISVAYQSAHKVRIIVVVKVAGEWSVINKVTMPHEMRPVSKVYRPSRATVARAKLPTFHFTKAPYKAKAIRLTPSQRTSRGRKVSLSTRKVYLKQRIGR